MRRFFQQALAISLIGFISSAIAYSQEEVRSKIEKGKADEVRTDINFIVGDLNIGPGSGPLSEGIYKYRRQIWEPQISYSEESHIGYLKITTRDTRDERNYNDNDKSDWDLMLNRDVPNDLRIRMAAGESKINLEDCRIRRFDFKMGAGKASINLSGTSLPDLDFSAGAGEAVIDLRGDWKNDLNAKIRGGVGEITLRVPDDTGIEMTITGMLGDVDTPGFRRQGNNYTNSLAGKTKQTLYIDITGGIGNVKITY